MDEYSLLTICRAISRFWPIILIEIDIDRNTNIFECQMRRLIFIMISSWTRKVSQNIKAKDIIWLGVIDFCTFRSLKNKPIKTLQYHNSITHYPSTHLLKRFMIFVVSPSPWLFPSCNKPIKTWINNKWKESIIRMCGTNVSDSV
jgi:hypothetical protein